ncbi:hypothetical protein [Cerasicoccus frondis]|uniref:hypothetical protein n=1 Tax=Cerasicoccus frondis TaxID=490090 RepID=UPI002852AD55|nr:hypothetical protein [Cerasicoccus frondis]
MHLATRTPDDDREMIRLAEASYWHWQYAAGRKASNDAVGLWLLSRVYAMTGDAATAIDYALKGAEVVARYRLDAFYAGYAWESAARAYFLDGQSSKAEEALAKAKLAAAEVADPANKAALEMDLQSVRPVNETSGSAIA